MQDAKSSSTSSRMRILHLPCSASNCAHSQSIGIWLDTLEVKHKPELTCSGLQLTFRTYNRDFDLPHHNEDDLAPLLRDSLMPGELV